MARELKDEINPTGSEEDVSESSTPLSNGIQIPLSEEMQDNLVDIVLEDYQSAIAEKNERSYGTTSRGIKLKFEDWRKELLDLYNSERIPKTIPWRFCSNRSLRIAKAIGDMPHSRYSPPFPTKNY